jgi:4-amino-4-deoxy-L-arabinose transferase-like glycosyltransferase
MLSSKMPRAGAERLPVALRWLLLAVTLTGVAWALVVPAWQVPDEDAHYAYVQTIAERGRLPERGGAVTDGGKSSAQQLAERMSGFRRSYQRLEAKPEWSREVQQRLEREESALGDAGRDDGAGTNAVALNPPTFYLYASLAYVAAGGTVLDRLYAMRLWSVPLLLAYAVAAWLLAGELARRDRLAQLCAGAIAALLPMVTFVSTGVTPDAMLLPLWGTAVWLGARGLRRGFTRGDAIALLLVTLAASAVKPIGTALVPGVLFALAVAAWRRRGLAPPSRAALTWAVLGATVVAAAAVLAVWIPDAPTRFASYLWQFYLPELPGQDHFARLQQWPVRDVWFEGVTGAFGWLEIRFPGWFYGLLALGAALLMAGAVRVRRWDPALLAFLALPALALLAGLHVIEYRSLVLSDRGFAQGRYLLPLVPLAAAMAGVGIATLPDHRRTPAAALVLGGMVAWQLGALAIVTARFYA